MKTLLVILAVLASFSRAAPSYGPGHLGQVAVHEEIHAGVPVAETQVHHGVVGSRTVQVGSRTVLDGHQYVVAGSSVEQPPAYSYVAGEPKTYQNTVPLPLPAIPAPAGPVIPPPPRNYGPAPPDTVTQERILAPVRTHTRITPQIRRVEPELVVNKVPVEVPVPNPVPVEKPVVYQKHVPKPYTVEVPQPYAVPQPYKVHPVQQVVETPVIEQTSYSVHQPVAEVNYGYTAVAEAAPAASYGYAAATPTVAEATYGYAAGVQAVAEAAPTAAYGYLAGAPAVAEATYGYTAGAPAVAEAAPATAYGYAAASPYATLNQGALPYSGYGYGAVNGYGTAYGYGAAAAAAVH